MVREEADRMQYRAGGNVVAGAEMVRKWCLIAREAEMRKKQERDLCMPTCMRPARRSVLAGRSLEWTPEE